MNILLQQCTSNWWLIFNIVSISIFFKITSTSYQQFLQIHHWLLFHIFIFRFKPRFFKISNKHELIIAWTNKLENNKWILRINKCRSSIFFIELRLYIYYSILFIYIYIDFNLRLCKIIDIDKAMVWTFEHKLHTIDLPFTLFWTCHNLKHSLLYFSTAVESMGCYLKNWL